MQSLIRANLVTVNHSSVIGVKTYPQIQKGAATTNYRPTVVRLEMPAQLTTALIEPLAPPVQWVGASGAHRVKSVFHHIHGPVHYPPTVFPIQSVNELSQSLSVTFERSPIGSL